jgi:hypothetical protein
MRRRSLLTAAVLGVGSVLGGCSEATTEDDGSTASPSTPEPTVRPSEKAAGRLLDARDYLKSAFEGLTSQTDQFSGLEDSYQSDSRSILYNIQRARTGLDQAKSNATAEQEDTIKQLRLYADMLEGYTNGFDQLVLGLNLFIITFDYFGNERWQASVDQLDEARTEFRAAVKKMGSGREAIDNIDPDFLEKSDRFSLQTSQATTTELINFAKAMIHVCNSWESLSLGAADLFKGLNEGDTEQYSLAKQSLQAAYEHFIGAETASMAAEDDSPNKYQSTFILQTCLVTPFKNSAILYRDGVVALERGDSQEGAKLIDEGTTELEKVDNCSA